MRVIFKQVSFIHGMWSAVVQEKGLLTGMMENKVVVMGRVAETTERKWDRFQKG